MLVQGKGIISGSEAFHPDISEMAEKLLYYVTDCGIYFLRIWISDRARKLRKLYAAVCYKRGAGSFCGGKHLSDSGRPGGIL